MQKNGTDPGAVFATRNLSLNSLPKPLLEKLAPHMMHMDLPQNTLLVKSEREIAWIYFLDHGMGSVSNLDANGTPLEVGIIGREGMIGVQALLGHRTTRNTVLMQGAGNGLRIRTEILREHVNGSPEFAKAVHTFVFSMLEQTTQLVLCNRLHDLEGRLARWLLMASDCMETRTLQLTQEFLAEMLGVGRPAVTIAAGMLQRSGLITYSRGQVEVRDPAKLKSVACECYGVIHGSLQSVYPSLY